MYQQKSQSLSDNEISQKVELFISARKLDDLDTFTTTDSFLVIHLQEPGKNKKRIFKSKVYWNDLNPNYAQTLVLDFVFEIRQKLTFEIFHESQPPKLVGRLNASLGQIFGSPTNGLIKTISNDNGKEGGKIIIRCQKVQTGVKKTFTGQLSAEKLPNLSWWWFFGGTFPFYRIFRKRQKDQLLVYESQVIQTHTTNPTWKQFTISEQKLCKNNEDNDIEIRIYSHSSRGNHTLLGSSLLTMKQIEKGKEFQIKNKEGKNQGSIVFKENKRTIQHQFGDFIEHGLQLALVTCVDFTASNGSPSSPTSLHYSTVYKKSQYQEAMSEVLSILMDYDYDKLVPCFGFGAQVNHPRMNTYGKVSHCFPINCNNDNPDIYGKEEIMKTYRDILYHLKFSGPTKFQHLLKNAIQNCKDFQKNTVKSQYMILFILTDGQIHDKNEVKDLLIQCNRLPLSVIIVGVGNGEFEIMKQLDDDDCEMTDSKGNRTERDLVQFVEFKNFANNGVELARQVLFELPRQVSEYYNLVGVDPKDLKRKQSDVEQQMKIKEHLI